MTVLTALLSCCALLVQGTPTLIASTQDKNAFTGFAFPFLAHGHLVFNGHTSGSSGLYTANLNTANLSDTSGSIREIVSTSEGFTTFSAPSVAKNGVVYLARKTDGSEGIYMDTHTGQRSIVVDSNTKIPGSDINFWFLSSPSLNDASGVSFLGSTAHATNGIFHADAKGSIAALVDDRSSIPNRPTRGFSIISRPQSNEDNIVVFFGSAPPSPRYQTHRRTIGTSHEVPNLMFGTQALAQGPSANHALHLEAGAFGTEWNEPADDLQLKSGDDYPFATPGIYAVEGGKLQALADWTMALPNCDGSKRRKKGETFSAFSDVSISGDYAAFIARGNQGTMGVYRVSVSSGAISCMADNQLPIPGTTSGYFGDFPQAPSVHIDGSVSFMALASGTHTGMYYASASGTIKATVTTDSVFEGGFSPIYMGAAGNAYDGERVAFYAVTDNSMDGVYYAETA